MFVNYGGGGYWFLDHSIWHGLTIADLVMPWFMFMMGVRLVRSLRAPYIYMGHTIWPYNMNHIIRTISYGPYHIALKVFLHIICLENNFSFTFSMKSMVKKGWTKRAMFIRILERSAKLFILGLFIVNSSDSWQTLRVPGVLQRFAICYIVVGGLQERI